ncbi:TPA: glycosyltransferase [Photobacterium damselae]
MKKHYKYVIINNVPAFYKINLFNKLAKLCSIKVIFISNKSLMRNNDFINAEMNFDYEIINDIPFESRKKIKTLLTISKILKTISYDKILYPGWEIIELLPIMFINPRDKNGIVIESSIKETKTTGIIWQLKKCIMSRMGYAYPSGFLQSEILKKASFTGNVNITHGVGIASREARIINESNINGSLKYLYVGRLSEEKNIIKLVNECLKYNRVLSIVGEGPLLNQIKDLISGSDIIKLYGYVNNNKLSTIYRDHNIFILPSISEPWGLVVDEALYYGLPCMVSKYVGCSEDLIVNTKSGIVFDSKSDYLDSFIKIEENYLTFKFNAKKINFEYRDEIQLSAYIK